MTFKHRSLVRWMAVATFLVGLANGILFYFNGRPQTAFVAALCILVGIGYLMAIGVHSGSE
jgi:hypothetical protein